MELLNQGHKTSLVQPIDKTLYPSVDDQFRLSHCRLAIGLSRLDNAGEIVNGVQIDIAQGLHLWLDVSGTAKSTIKMGRFFLAFNALSTAPRPIKGKVLAVQLITISNSWSLWGKSANRMDSPLNC
jgi:hypothetical protein